MKKYSLVHEVYLGSFYLLAFLLFLTLFLTSRAKLPLEAISFGILLFFFNFFNITLPVFGLPLVFPFLLASLLSTGLATTSIISIFAALKWDDIKEKTPIYFIFLNLCEYLISIQVAGYLYFWLKALGQNWVYPGASTVLPFLVLILTYFFFYNLFKSLRGIIFEDLKIEQLLPKLQIPHLFQGYLILSILGLLFSVVYNNGSVLGVFSFAVPLFILREIFLMSQEEEKNFFPNLSSFISSLEEKAFSAKDHSIEVEKIAEKIGKKVGLSPKEMKILRTAVYLHDIGMISEARGIITKPELLTREEFEKIKQHPQIASSVMEELNLNKEARSYILSHHERFDGTGYPEGLVGGSIPLLSRIILVAESFQAMISPRPYRQHMEREEAIEEIKNFSGTQFDPEIVEAFLALLEEEKR